MNGQIKRQLQHSQKDKERISQELCQSNKVKVNLLKVKGQCEADNDNLYF